MLKVGNFVTRKKYNNDIVFKIERIENNKIILKGVDLRLYADSYEDDLQLVTINTNNETSELARKLDTNNYFYIPATILHIDSDDDYIKKCKKYYEKHKLRCYTYKFDEKDYSKNICKLVKKHNPQIIVITGHDAYYKNNIYKNSKYFIDSINELKKEFNNFNSFKIISGACQSDFEGQIKAGATFASSPGHINISALDPAIIATYIALSDKNEVINLSEILSKTKYKENGIGGIETYGTMIVGMPRKDKN